MAVGGGLVVTFIFQLLYPWGWSLQSQSGGPQSWSRHVGIKCKAVSLFKIKPRLTDIAYLTYFSYSETFLPLPFDSHWMLQENHQGNHSLLIEDNVEMNNVVYMFNCHDSTLTVKGKLNSVFLDSCRKSSVVFDSLVSSVEFVNCQSVQMQVCLIQINFAFWQNKGFWLHL